MSLNEIGSMVAMQGFSGLSLFTVLLLMALGLAIIFGQMGVINMAHGEFMAIGAYVVYLFSQLTQNFAPGLREVYFVPAVVAAFFVAAGVGYVVEVLLIRRLYKGPSTRCSPPGASAWQCSNFSAPSSTQRRSAQSCPSGCWEPSTQRPPFRCRGTASS